jgi:hypothetical protein
VLRFANQPVDKKATYKSNEVRALNTMFIQKGVSRCARNIESLFITNTLFGP